MKIPKAVREQSWITHCGKKFETKCSVTWCKNIINVFNFHCGHNIPNSAGGSIEIENLIPICANCNIGMGDRFTIKQWSKMYKRKSNTFFNWATFSFCCDEPKALQPETKVENAKTKVDET